MDIFCVAVLCFGVEKLPSSVHYSIASEEFKIRKAFLCLRFTSFKDVSNSYTTGTSRHYQSEGRQKDLESHDFWQGIKLLLKAVVIIKLLRLREYIGISSSMVVYDYYAIRYLCPKVSREHVIVCFTL